MAIFRSQYLLTVDSAYADLRAVDPNPFPMNDRDGPWLRNVFNGLRKDYTLMMQRWNASGQQNPEAEVADFISGLPNPKALRLMFEVYDGQELADYVDRTLPGDCAVDTGVGETDTDNDTEGWQVAEPSAESSAGPEEPAPPPSPAAAPTQVPAPTTTDNVVRRRTRHRRTSTGNKRRRPSPPEPPVVVNNLRADAALERMAAAKEDAARSQWRSQCNHHCVFVSSHQPSSMYRYRRVPAFSAIQRRAENRSTVDLLS